MLLVVGAGVLGVSVFLDTFTKHDEFVEVPDFAGFHYSEVDEYISDKNLRFEITDSIFNPKMERGIVLEQLPHSGELVKPNRKVYLTINSVTPPSVILPELRDITVRQVVSKIETYGLKVDSLIYKPAECDNCVIGVVFEGEEIEPGTRIEKGKSISLIIGEGIGTQKVDIPYLYKLRLADVRTLLNSKGLNMGFPEYDSTILNKEDTLNAFVYKQEPAYDTNNTVRQGRAFDLFFTLDSNKLEGLELNIADTIITESNE
jgi:beta-lactam-binding protein with PASTA domain